MTPRVMDLFAGVGGFALGATFTGFRTILAVENDPDLSFSFNINFPSVKVANEDLSKVPAERLLELAGAKLGEIEGVVGGPPCQGFSTIGKQDPDDPRSGLVGRFFHYVSAIQPAFFVMENVPGLLSRFPSTLTAGLERLDGMYTVLPPVILDAADFGAPTSRSRVFVVGYDPERVERVEPAELVADASPERTTVADAISDLPSPGSGNDGESGYYWTLYDREVKTEYARRAREAPPDGLSTDQVRKTLAERLVSGMRPTYHTQEVLDRFAIVKQGGVDNVSRCRRLSWSGLCPTLRAGTGRNHGSHQALRPIHPEADRVITVREAARLQGFPDWFQFHPTNWHSFRMIGNSVSPFVSEALLKAVESKLRL